MHTFTFVAALSALVTSTQAYDKGRPQPWHHYPDPSSSSPDCSSASITSSAIASPLGNSTSSASISTTSISATGTTSTTTTTSSSVGSATAKCSSNNSTILPSLPSSFYVQDFDLYLAANLGASVNGSVTLTEVSNQADATVFYITNAPVEHFGTLNQLAFNASDPVSGNTSTYAAWVQGGSGGAISFFSTSAPAVNLTVANYFPVLGAAGELPCSLGLGVFFNKYIVYPSNCGGTIWLDTFVNVTGCTVLSLTVSTAIV